MKEETGLDMRVGKLLIEQVAYPGGMYKRLKSYICTPIGGQPEPGSEPEVEVNFEIAAVRWFDLKDISKWSIDLCQDPYTYPHLVKVRQLLGYTTKTWYWTEYEDHSIPIREKTDNIFLTYLVRLIDQRDFNEPNKHYNHP